MDLRVRIMFMKHMQPFICEVSQSVDQNVVRYRFYQLVEISKSQWNKALFALQLKLTAVICEQAATCNVVVSIIFRLKQDNVWIANLKWGF